MKFLTVLSLFAATSYAAFENVTSSDTVAPAPSNNGTATDLSTDYVTEVATVTEFTTYCPEPTTIVTNGKTIVVTEATTLTITDCPCVITKTHETPKAPEEETTAPPAKPTTKAPPAEKTVTSQKPPASTSHEVQTFDNLGNKVTIGLTGALSLLALFL